MNRRIAEAQVVHKRAQSERSVTIATRRCYAMLEPKGYKRVSRETERDTATEQCETINTQENTCTVEALCRRNVAYTSLSAGAVEKSTNNERDSYAL